jgi:hypothetical protein
VTNVPPSGGYGSAADLPSFKKLQSDLASAKLLAGLKPSLRPQLLEIEATMKQLVTAVDTFYTLIGARNWVFHQTLSVDKMQPALDANDADDVQAAVIAQYQDELALDVLVNQLKRLDDMRTRIPLLFKAKTDFRAGRYYSVVLLLISVMDGFVNDVERSRRGLHARDEDEMVAWDSVVGHHMGLRNAHRTFTRTFKATSDEEVFELYRNGIVHGNLTNFDNVIVASKAWNRLFAVVDWAESVEKAKVPDKPPATWASVAARLRQTSEDKKHIAAWQPRSASIDDADDGATLFEEPAVQAANELFTYWMHSNFGGMSFRMKPMTKPKSANELAGKTRSNFEGFKLDEFQITAASSVAAAVCSVTATLTVNGVECLSETRWVFEGKDGRSLAETQSGGRWICLQALPEALARGARPAHSRPG